jgi:hypothetical protein
MPSQDIQADRDLRTKWTFHLMPATSGFGTFEQRIPWVGANVL